MLFFLGFGLTGGRAQEAIVTSGGDATGSGGSVSYSAGQVTYTKYSDSDGSVTQKIQQVYTITVETGLDQAGDITLQSSAYPNPATDQLILKISARGPTEYALHQQKLSFQLYGIHGNIIETREITATETTIPLNRLAPGCYFVKIRSDKRSIKTFKIIKIQ
jgi:hypothetical protein